MQIEEKCKHCGHFESKHIEGVGCDGAFTEEEKRTASPEELFYGECLCQHFENPNENVCPS